LDFGKLLIPSLSNLLSSPELNSLVSESTLITAKYTAATLSDDNKFLDIDTDIVLLSACLLKLSLHVGWYQALSQKIETSERYVKSKAFGYSKSGAETLGFKVTDSESEHISREISTEEFLEYSITDAVTKVIVNYYYALRSFVEMLSSVANRLSRQP